jgi:ubiquitin-protein ligase
MSSSKIRRITKELEKYENEVLSKKLQCYLVDSFDNTLIFIKFIPQDYLINIVLKYPQEYPWRSPKITINGHSYMELLQIRDTWKLKYIKCKCLCCSSLMCFSNWSPTKDINDILTEVCNNLYIKLKFNEIRHVKKIKYKYLNPDIPIEEFL